MIKLILRASLLSAMLMAMTAIANADTLVTYSTQGCFGVACVPVAGISQTPAGTGFLNYHGQASTSVNVPSASPFFTTAQLGFFDWTQPANATLNTPFKLQITQTVPGPSGSQVFSATVTGIVQSTPSSSVQVIFSTAVVTINGVNYQLTNLGGPGTTNPMALLINPPGQSTTVNSIVTVPEPTSMLLLGTGLLGAAGAVRRRFKRN